jgi:hypothetical protein
VIFKPTFIAIGLITRIAGNAIITAYIQFLGHTCQNNPLSVKAIYVTHELISIVIKEAVINVVIHRRNVSFFII